jgi:hypothetical protein
MLILLLQAIYEFVDLVPGFNSGRSLAILPPLPSGPVYTHMGTSGEHLKTTRFNAAFQNWYLFLYINHSATIRNFAN